MKLGIIGGMGPMATAHLFQRIIEKTDAITDQEHIHIIIDNNTKIPDRTNYILGTGENPLEKMVESVNRLQEAGADLLVMPCNTAHFFYQEIIKQTQVKMINMVEETKKYISENYDQGVGVLGTSGTRRSGLYNIPGMLEISDHDQMLVMDLIYNIKSNNYQIDIYNHLIKSLSSKGWKHFVLGCTELSIFASKINHQYSLIDPLEILAEKAITILGYPLKK